MDAVLVSLRNTSTGVLTSLALGLLTAAVVVGKLLIGGRRLLKRPPAVPGLPLIGNLHQLKEKKPHRTFAKWAETYGPIYSIRTGTSTVAVLNSTEVAKEAMVTRFSSISTRKLSNALMLLTSNKSMVATCDYGEFHKMVKRYILASVLGANAQKRHRGLRETMIDNIVNILHLVIKDNPQSAVELRGPFKTELFRLALTEALGKDVESIYVEELGQEMTKQEIFDVLVVDPMMGAIEVDWRDFFPYLRWVPNRSMEMKIQRMVTRKRAVTTALINEQKKRIALGEARHCYLDFLLSENTLSEEQLTTLIWEAIIEGCTVEPSPLNAEALARNFGFRTPPDGESLIPDWQSSGLLQRRQQQQLSPFSVVNKALPPSSSGVSLQMEPPSNQSNYNVSSFWPEERVVGMKRRWPFHLDSMPGHTSFPCKNPSFSSSHLKPNESLPDLIKSETKTAYFRGETSSSSICNIEHKRFVDLDNSNKENGGAMDGGFLSLGPSPTLCIPKLPPTLLDYPEFSFVPSQGSMSDAISSSQPPFYSFLPMGPNSCEKTLNEPRREALDGVDLNLKL